METVLYLDETRTGPRGVVVVPERFGINSHAKEKAQGLAALGYLTPVRDLYGDSKTVRTLEEVMAFIGSLVGDSQRISAYAETGLKALTRGGCESAGLHWRGRLNDKETDTRGEPNVLRYSASAYRRSWESLQSK